MSNGDFGRLEFLRRLGRLPSQAQMVQQPSMGPARVPPSIMRQPSAPALSPSMQRLADLNAARYVAGVPSPYRMPSPAAQPAVDGGPQLPPPPTQMARPAGLTPMDRAGLAAGIAGLQYAGPQTQPTSFAQGLGVMGQAAMEAFDVAEQREEERAAAKAEAERQRRADEAIAKYRQAQLDLKREEIRADAAAAKAQADAEAAKALLPDVKGESTLRREYDQQSKSFVNARIGFEKLQEASLGDPSAAKDLSLIFGYMKLLDPTSVVRESEQASASNAAGVPERIRNIWNRLLTGERLTPEQRLDFISSGRRLFLPYIADQTEREKFYSGLAEEYNFKAARAVPTKLPEKGSRTNPYIYANEAEAEAAGLTGFAYIGGRFVEITE